MARDTVSFPLIPAGEGWIALGTEGGHVNFGPRDEREMDILKFAWKTLDHVSYERLISGPGLELIYRALADRHGVQVEPLLAPAITRRLIGRFAGQLGARKDIADRLERLTGREREVLQALAGGLNNQEISEALFIGPATVKSHISSLLSKLGLRDRAQAVVFAYESGLAKAGERDIGF